MGIGRDRLLQFERDLLNGKNICSSRGIFVTFPSPLQAPFRMKGLGVIVCGQGEFLFLLNQKKHLAKAGESLFMYSRLTSEAPSCVWNTGEEEDILKYMSLLDSALQPEENSFKFYEQKLLLLALTYRICSIYNRKLVGERRDAGGRKRETFIRLIQLIEQHYMQERGVEFYADKLCLSPKYLSAISKSICGYTVQELVFKAIIRKCISLLKNTQKNIQEISNDFGFPNASYFGTFFKKQMGMSPQQYRKSL